MLGGWGVTGLGPLPSRCEGGVATPEARGVLGAGGGGDSVRRTHPAGCGILGDPHIVVGRAIGLVLTWDLGIKKGIGTPENPAPVG